ncbi:MAG: transposase [Methyloprofundus sp.]
MEKDEELIYRLSKPQHDGQTGLRLTPMEFLDRMTVLIPPPGCHRHRYHGVLAPNAPLRKAVSECAGLRVESEKAVVEEEETHSVDREEHVTGSFYSSIWAMLLAKIFEINPLLCPSCGGEMKMIAFVTETEPIRKILRHIGELDHAPSISPSRDPPVFYAEIDQTQSWDDHAAKAITEYEFDQTVSW